MNIYSAFPPQYPARNATKLMILTSPRRHRRVNVSSLVFSLAVLFFLATNDIISPWEARLGVMHSGLTSDSRRVWNIRTPGLLQVVRTESKNLQNFLKGNS
jgi:hypothetical protein